MFVYFISVRLPSKQPEINRLSLNWCSPYTEIFSKRRKICSVCVESLSIQEVPNQTEPLAVCLHRVVSSKGFHGASVVLFV